MDCTHPIIIRNPSWLPDVRSGFAVYGGSLKFSDLPAEAGIKVRCGKCFNCRRFRAREWTHRLILENVYHEDAIFITLTYDDDHVPFSPSGRQTLVKKDLQNFFKRLRLDLDMEDRKIMHFSCGEYGDKFGRPHYHSIIFGMSHKDRKLIEDNWPNGLIHIGTVTSSSIAYCCGYIQKKLYGKPAEEIDIVQPFSVCSTRPAIGLQFCLDNYEKLYKDGFIQFPGYRVGLPRFYRKKLEEEFGFVFDWSYYSSFSDEANEKERKYWQDRLKLDYVIEHDDGFVEFVNVDTYLPTLEYYKNATLEKNRVAKARMSSKGKF